MGKEKVPRCVTTRDRGPNLERKVGAMGKLAQVAMAAGLAALGCSSSTVNDSGATGGAGSGGAAGASGASSGGTSSLDGGYLKCPKGASPAPECEPLCGELWPVCVSGLCTCRNTAEECTPGTLVGCPSSLQCTLAKHCVPIGNRHEGEECSWPLDSGATTPDAVCQLGTDCLWSGTDGGGEYRCRRLCDPKAPPLNCTCDAVKGWCK